MLESRTDGGTSIDAAQTCINALEKPKMLGRERLLGIPDVCAITGFCPAVASTFMKESGRALELHRRVFILESSLFAYLHELEEASDDQPRL